MKFLKGIYDITIHICNVFMIAMVVVVTIAVVGRYVFNSTPAWSEEMALFCFTWFGFLSASLAEFDDSHIRIKVIDNYLPKIVKTILRFMYTLIKLAFVAILVIEGTKLVLLTMDSVMGGFRVSYGWLNLAAPVTGVFLLLFLIGNFFTKNKGEGEIID